MQSIIESFVVDVSEYVINATILKQVMLNTWSHTVIQKKNERFVIGDNNQDQVLSTMLRSLNKVLIDKELVS